MRGSRKHKLVDYYLGISLVGLLGILKRIIPARFFKKKQKPRRVLFIKLAAIGDTVLFLTAVKAFKVKFPDVELDFLCSPINRELLERVPFINRLWVMPLSGKQFRLKAVLQMCGEIRGQAYDLAIDGEQWSRITPLIAFYARINKLVGFKTPGQYRHYLFDEAIDHGQNAHELELFKDLVKGLGVTEFEPPQIYFKEEDARKGGKLLRELTRKDAKTIIIHPGCGSHGWQREWPPENYVRLITGLRKELGKVTVIFTGGKSEVALGEELKVKLGDTVNLCGRLELMEMCFLISGADIFISGNTGPMHIAAAVKTPLIALHGPTDQRKWGPVATSAGAMVIKSPLECSPCLSLGFEYQCGGNECLRSIEPGEVLAAALKLLGTVKRDA